MDRKPTLICTLVTQLCLCCALYAALNLGQPQKSIYTKSNDFYFISVAGGYWTVQQQTHLLKLMRRVAKSYEVSFVVNTSEFGDDDPLTQNATIFFNSLKIPWYTTTASKEQEFQCFRERIKLPHDETLDIIGVNTSPLLTMLSGLSNDTANKQMNSMTRILETANGNWLIVVGFHPLIVRKENKNSSEAKRISNSLHHIFMKSGVDMYLSTHGCPKYSRRDTVTYIQNPDSIKPANGIETIVDGFLLHRVSSLEIVTFFVTSTGKVELRTVLGRKPKEVL